MRKHSIILRLGSNDTEPIETAKDYVITEVPFFHEGIVAGNRITHDRLIEELRKNGLTPSNLGWDILFLALIVFTADTRIPRSSESQDGWSREIELVIPVTDPKLWQEQATLISDTLKFLTGDLWRLSFRPRPKDFVEIPLQAKKKIDEYFPSVVSLFSGGLDSFIGAIDLVSKNESPLLVGHRKSGDVGTPQKNAFEYLTKVSKKDALRFAAFMVRPPDSTIIGGDEKSERGRSFLFLALAVLCASGAEKCRLIVPENGLISLNVPLTASRLGANSTRTTHPYYLKNYQTLLKNLGLNITIENPYQFKTKGEMIAQCANPKVLKDHISQTVSCASPSSSRWKKDSPSSRQCGHCVPCIIRRAAIEAALKRDQTNYSINIHEGQEFKGTSGQQIHAFKIACGRLRKDKSLAKFLIHKSGPLSSDTDFVEKAAELYLRGMEEVAKLVTSVNLRK